MPSILSKFTKSGSDIDRGGSAHRRAHTTSESRSTTPSASSSENPRLVLTSESTESLKLPTERSPPRSDSIPMPNQSERSQTLYPNSEEGRARKAFAEKMRDGGRRALSVGAHGQVDGPNDDDLTPGPHRAVPAPPTREVPPVPDLPPRSQTEVPRPRRISATSQSKKDVPPVPLIMTTPQQKTQPLVSSPTSESPPVTPPAAKETQKDDLKRAASEKKKSSTTNSGWQRRASLSSSKSGNKSPPRRIHPSGGLASAIAGSGLALANPAIQRPLMPAVNPVAATATRHRHNSSTSEVGPIGRDRHAQSRKSSMSQNHHDNAVLQDDANNDNSGSSGTESEEDSSDNDLDPLADGVAPITGFAVASNKRTADFHALFPSVPEGDYLIDDYGCALQREILIQGRLYISENHVCFHANIFGWTTDLVIPIDDITSIEKRMTAYVIPNALQINTYNGKYAFASLLSRDTTYDVIYNIWRSVRPEGAPPSPRGSIDDSIGASMGSVIEGMAPPNGLAGPSVGAKRKATQCACGKEGKHYSEVAMDTVVPGEPEKIYNLMFASGFIKEFMRDDQKLQDIQISDWIPISNSSSKLLKRNMSYIKPLTGSIGPKQTKCELQDEMIHLDVSEYITMLTTTRTPDVPSGGVFAVKTRTCLMWAGAASTRILVTTQVEWTGRSFIKGIIEKSCLDGQKGYHADLERAMRKYIVDHRSEFVPQGIEVEEAVATPVTPAPTSPGPTSDEDIRKAKEKERNQRGAQWALDTVEGTMKVARQSFWGAIDLIKDAWDASETTAVLWFVVVLLLISNIYTWFRAGRLVEGPRVGGWKSVTRNEAVFGGEEKIEKVVGQSVREAFKAFEEIVRAEGAITLGGGGVGEIRKKIGELERRVRTLEGEAQKSRLEQEPLDKVD